MRITGKPALCAVIITELLFLAGCSGGGSTLTATQFRSRLNALCATATSFSRSLPHLQQSQHLSVDQLQARANREGLKVRADIDSLTPPASLSAPDHVLVADLSVRPSSGQPRPLTPAMLKTLERRDRKLLQDYTALGATGCELDEQQGIAAVEKLAAQEK